MNKQNFINCYLYSHRPDVEYLTTGSNSIHPTTDLFDKNEKLILKNETSNVRQIIDLFNKCANNHLSSIQNIELNRNEPLWTNERIYLRPVNKTLNLWNSNEQPNSKSFSSNITTQSIINMQVNHTDLSIDSPSVKDIINNINHKFNQLNCNVPMDKHNHYHKPKQHSFKMCTYPNVLHKDSIQTEQNQRPIDRKEGNEKENNADNNKPTVDECTYRNIELNSNLCFKQYTTFIQRNCYQNLGFSVSYMTSLFNETSNNYVVISDIQLLNQNKDLQIGDRILSVNKINLTNMDLMKAVKLLKSVQSPIQLEMQRLNIVDLSLDNDYEEDCLSVDTDTDEETEIITRIIDLAQNHFSGKRIKTNEQSKLENPQKIDQHEVKLTHTDNNNTINDTITKSEMQSQRTQLLQRKVMKWLFVYRAFIQSIKYRSKQLDKDEYECLELFAKTMNEIMKEDDPMDNDDETDDNANEKVWREGIVSSELKYFLTSLMR
ncbi:unnamed protein product [Schistosoma turkestanicum]|nr:unnamed protein product [Schistosoma turkestanicum]